MHTVSKTMVCPKQVLIFMFIFSYALQIFKAYFTIWVRRSNFRHQASPRVSPRKSTHRRKVELWERNVREFCLNADLNVTFRDLLHAVKLRHGTDGFTSPPKEGVLRIFWAGCKPANLVTKGQHATSIPPKPLSRCLHKYMYHIIHTQHQFT
jgi:hypothetical protein